MRYSSGSLPGTRAYTGQRADAATGLDYYNARYYDPLAGQFASADSDQKGGLNRYAYVGGNPETRSDPSGHHYACPDNDCGGGGGDEVGSGSGNGSAGIHQGTRRSAGDGGPCTNLSSCTRIRYGEGGAPGCHSATQYCFYGSDPGNLMQFAPAGFGKGATAILLMGKEGIEQFLSYLDDLQKKVDAAFEQAKSDLTHQSEIVGLFVDLVLGLLGAAAGPEGSVAGVWGGTFSVGKYFADQKQALDAQQSRVDDAFTDLHAELTTIEEVMAQPANAHAQYAIAVGVVSTPATDSNFDGPAWQLQSLAITDYYTWT